MIRASFGKSVARSTLLGSLVLLAVPAIAGCEAGDNAPTLEFHPAAAGATQNVNGISITDAFVLGAPAGSSLQPGSSASLFLSLFNSGNSNDKLVSVSAQGTASSVEIKGGSVTIPASGPANLTGPEPSLVLKDLKSQLQGGASVPLTLVFSGAGATTVNVPVEPQSFYWSTYSPPAASPSASPSASATPAGTAKANPGASATSTGTATPTGTATSTSTATPKPSPSATK